MTLPADEIRTSLINITLEHMDKGGIDAIKARPIAKQAGISVGTIYNVFGSINGLIEAANMYILEDFAQQALSTIPVEDEMRAQKLHDGIISPAQALQERLLSFAKVYMDFVEKHEARWNAMLSYNQHRSSDVVSVDYEQQQTDLFRFLGSSLQGTHLDEDEEARLTGARMLWSAVHGIVLLNYIGQVSEKSRLYTWTQIEIFVTNFVRGATK